jgi:hypothetical protein
MVKKLESSIKYKLEKLGLETGGRPIEIKVRTNNHLFICHHPDYFSVIILTISLPSS